MPADIPALARSIRTHFRPLTVSAAIYAGTLERCWEIDARMSVAGALDMSAREILIELLRLLPTATTEEQRWVTMQMRDLIAT